MRHTFLHSISTYARHTTPMYPLLLGLGTIDVHIRRLCKWVFINIRINRYSRTGDMREAQQGRTQGESEGEGAPRLLPSPAGLLAAPTQRAVGHRVLCAAI
jgi:hypothetical protein